MGRSGDITEPQPKAVGSSVLVKLTLLLVLDIVRRGSGLNAKGPAAHGILLPMCTGMSMALVLSHLRETEVDNTKTIVLWSRIDQKSCFKAIQSAGLTCVVVETKLEGDAVVTDMEAMEAAMKQYEGKVLAVITTTSCFAPRVPDMVDKVAKLCSGKNRTCFRKTALLRVTFIQ
jgi:O-phospho-L-seryl-tRNASec:L-selenocysteinyl-tRNA synthase